MSFSSLARLKTLGVRLFLIFSVVVRDVQCRSASEILAVFDKPIQLFGNVGIAISMPGHEQNLILHR
jgi:hypothetical protein